jgi:hypothetical protein
MASIVLVHGISVRGEDYHGFCEVVKQHLKGHKIVPCLWGDEFGTLSSKKGLSVPGVGDSDASDVDAADAQDEETTPISKLWDVLYGDPLYELAVLRIKPVKRIATPPSFSAMNTWKKRLDDLPSNERLAVDLEPLMISQGILRNAIEDLRNASSSEFRDAIKRHGADEGLLSSVISRALVAISASHLRNSDDSLPIDTNDWRNDSAESIANALTGQPKGFITKLFAPSIIKLGSRLVRARRPKITCAVAPFVGDVLTYLARGNEIRAAVSNCIEAADPPVAVVAHSLGGIICLEYLMEVLREGKTTKVERLVTVGSQSGLLYEFNALASCPFDSVHVSLPKGFPPWLNIWHPNDLLAYLVGPIFKSIESDDHVKDVEVYSNHEFPEAHSAYWENPDVYKQILDHIRSELPGRSKCSC